MLERQHEDIRWFDLARFGLFIHWGPYAATKGFYRGRETQGIVEWIQSRERIPAGEYREFAQQLSAEKFDAEAIVKMAKQAGMKYLVFTAKHHDGFAMFETAYDDFSFPALCTSGRDPAGELVAAARREGLVPCLYYSHSMDFHEENAMGNIWDFKTPESERDFNSYFNGKCKTQLKELLTNYGDLGMIWFDVPRGMTAAHVAELRAFVKSLQPHCLINGRIGGSKDDWDFVCMGDNEAPNGKLDFCGETAATLNNSWGYKLLDTSYKSPKEVIELLCQLTSKGANLLLNIGPLPDGSVAPQVKQIFQRLADWNKVNGEAICKTAASPYITDFSFGYMSQKKEELFVFVSRQQPYISFYGMDSRVLKAETMAGSPVGFIQDGEKLTLDLRTIRFDDSVTVLRLTLSEPMTEKERLVQQEPDFLLLPGYLCRITDNGETAAGYADVLDRVLGEYRDMTPGMNVNINGVVENWHSEESSISWDFSVKDPGRYQAVLYTITSKYRSWCGGHGVALSCGGQMLYRVLHEDSIPEGVNRRYFAETGSILGELDFEKSGDFSLKLMAENINKSDPAGLSVTKLILRKIH